MPEPPAVMTSGQNPAVLQPLLLKRANESELTYRLRWAAWQWLHEFARCRAIGFEVRLEGPGGRVTDVVGLGPGNRVFIVEVKASRSDAARDDNTGEDARKLARNTSSLDGAVELTAGVLEASTRLARERFGDTWRNDPAYQQAEADHRRALNRRDSHSKRLAAFSTKFHDPAYLRAADCHYIMAPSGLIRPSGLPPYWGLLDERPGLVVEAPVKQVRRVTAHVLRAIAVANTRDLGVVRSRIEGRSAAPGFSGSPRSFQS
jgi:hypothetical protein